MDDNSGLTPRLVGANGHAWLGQRRPRVMVVVENMRLFRTVMRVMNSLGANTALASSLSDVIDLITQPGEIDLLLFDLELEGQDTGQRDELLQQVSDIENAPPWILLSERQESDQLAKLFSMPFHGSVVAKIGDLQSSGLLVSTRKLLMRDIFGVDKYLRWGSVAHQYSLVESNARKHCIEGLEWFARELGIRGRLRSELLTVADEFLMNALYDAPTDEQGVHIAAELSRQENVSLAEEKSVTFEFGSDGQYMALGCRDPFGSLRPEKVLQSLTRCLKGGEDQIRDKAEGGGAGIGLYLIYKFVDFLVVNIHQGKATEFLGLVDLNIARRKRNDAGKTLNIFNII